MKSVRILSVIFTLVLLTLSCSHTNEQILRAEQLIETAPDSALSILNAFDYNKLSDKDKALYGLVYIRIRDKKFLSLEPDSLLSFAINYYNNEQEKTRLCDCYLLIGKKFKSQYKYEEAMNYFINVSELINDNNKLLGNAYINMADIHSFQSDYDIARLKYKKAYKYFQLAKMKQQSFYAQLFIGKTYSLDGQYLKADKYYKKLIKQINDSVLIGTLYQEIGQNFYKNVQYDSALSYLDRVKGYPYIGLNRAIRLSYLSKVYFELKKYDSAFYYANEIFKYQSEIRLQRESYRIMTNCEFINGRTKNVTKYMNKYVELGDSIYKLDKQTKGSYIETMHNTQKEAAKSRSWIWYLSVVLLLIIILSVVIYIQKHKKTNRKILLAEQNYNLQKAEIRRESIIKKQSELLAGIERIKMVQKKSDKNAANRHERVKTMYNELLHLQDTALFLCEMDAALNNIVTKLKANAPDIKEKELIWCSLHLLNIPTHDLLILLNYESINSLKRLKGRLAPKLGIENAGLLNEYLLRLLTVD